MPELTRQEKRIARLKEQINLNPDVQVSLGDSTAAGNCETGSMSFSEKYFPERVAIGTVTLAQLKPYLNNPDYGYGVCAVVIHKLREVGAISSTEEEEEEI